MKDTKMSITIRYNGSSIHLQGIAASTPYTGNGDDNETGVVAYYAESACGSLTRNGYRMATGKTFETASEALEGAHHMAATYGGGLKVCKNCEKAAKWAASCEMDTESEEFAAEKTRVNVELEESNRRYKEAEASRKTKAEAPAIDDHAAAVAQIRANIDAEEEERAAARRARNRTNYAPAPEAREDATITREPEGRTLTEVEEMEDRYQDLVLVGRGLRLLSDQFCRMLAEMKDGEGLGEDHPRRVKMHAKLMKSMDLEDANLKAREALHAEIREARNRGRCLQRGGDRGSTPLQCLHLRDHTGDCKNSRGETFTNWTDPEAKMYAFGSGPEEKPLHRQVKDAIGLEW